jgi:hypothetical protein
MLFVRYTLNTYRPYVNSVSLYINKHTNKCLNKYSNSYINKSIGEKDEGDSLA